MLQKILKEKTQALHNELENMMFVKEIMNKTLSLYQYKKNITVNYIVHKRFEHHLLSQLSNGIKNKLNVELRKKLPALKKDIQQLNVNEGEVPLNSNPEQKILPNDAFILGALYVLEGATLGGHVIAKNLSSNPNFVEENIPLNYYKVYGDDLMNNWKSFIAVLNEISEENHQHAVDGAMMMFNEMITTARIYN